MFRSEENRKKSNEISFDSINRNRYYSIFHSDEYMRNYIRTIY